MTNIRQSLNRFYWQYIKVFTSSLNVYITEQRNCRYALQAWTQIVKVGVKKCSFSILSILLSGYLTFSSSASDTKCWVSFFRKDETFGFTPREISWSILFLICFLAFMVSVESSWNVVGIIRVDGEFVTWDGFKVHFIYKIKSNIRKNCLFGVVE